MLGRALQRHPTVALLTFLLTLAAAVLVLVLTPERYEAEARLLVATPRDPLVRELRLVDSPENVAQLAVSASVLERAAVRLRPNVDASGLRTAVDADRADASDVVVVRAESGDEILAAQIANVVADEVVRHLSGRFQAAVTQELAILDQRLATGSEAERGSLRARRQRLRALQGERAPGVEVLGSAVTPADPVEPRRLAILGAGAGAAVLLALLVSLALDWEPRRTRAARPEPTERGERRYSIADLERMVARRLKESPGRRAEWEAYLVEFRNRANGDELSPGLHALAVDVFQAAGRPLWRRRLERFL